MCLQHDDCLYNFFYWLDVKNIINCSLINKQFLNVSQHELLWKKLYDFNIPCYQHYYHTFKQFYELNQFLLRHTRKSLNETLKIQRLDLYNKQIKTMPSALGQLKQLQYLNLSHNQLTDISALGRLTQLQYIDLRHNQLTDITTLGQLQQLQYIDLRHNQLTDITSLGQCQQLQVLYLGHNQLTDISALSQLKQLQSLDLNHNQLTDISALDQLLQLQYIDLSHNQLTDITTLSQCQKLHIII